MNCLRFLFRQHFRWRKSCGCFLMFIMLAYILSFLAVKHRAREQLRHVITSNEAGPSEPKAAPTTSHSVSVTGTSPGPVVVIILTYQRSGSTFLGQIFNRNPDAFYTFEPLDGLYSAIYGTSQGYNAPSDITQYWNGTERIIPDFEIRSSAAVIDNLLTCKHQELPSEILTNIFWVGFKSEHLTIRKYVQCLSDRKIIYNSCKGKLRSCKIWLGQKGSKQNICRQELWLDTSPNPSPTRPEFKAYKKCIEAYRQKASPCFPALADACQKADIRSTKVVRLSMRAIELLLEKYPQRLKVLHLLRDPKAVVVSRMKYESVRGHYAGSNKVEEAKTLCKVIQNDLLVRRRLQQKYPDVFYQVIYEELIKNPVHITRDIYSHIGKTVPKTLEEFMAHETSRNNTRPIQGLSEHETQKIDAVCSGMYKDIGYEWH